MPADMLFVQVRPRKYKGHSPGKPLFKVDVHKVKLVFDWLKQHNPYYYHVEWRMDAAAAWSWGRIPITLVWLLPRNAPSSANAIVSYTWRMRMFRDDENENE